MNLDKPQVGSHGLVNAGLLFPNMKPPYLKKALHAGLLIVRCIFESESQMLRSDYFEREILSPTTAAMVEPGAMCTLCDNVPPPPLCNSETFSPPLFHRCGKPRMCLSSIIYSGPHRNG